MSKYFAEARKTKSATGEKLISFLESRLDNVVFRAGFASSRDEARQMITHGKILVNTKKTRVPSLQIKTGDEIKLGAQGKKTKEEGRAVGWLKAAGAKAVLVGRIPKGDDVQEPFNEQLIIEYYSR